MHGKNSKAFKQYSSKYAFWKETPQIVASFKNFENSTKKKKQSGRAQIILRLASYYHKVVRAFAKKKDITALTKETQNKKESAQEELGLGGKGRL